MKTGIFPMKKEHISSVTKLADQLGYPGNESDILTRLEWLQTLSNHGLFIYQKNDVVLGWIHLELVYDLIEKTMTEIKAIVVDETARGLGVGHALIEHAKTWSKDRGQDAIYLSCNILRDRTHKFYQREGFRTDRTSHFFVLDL